MYVWYSVEAVTGYAFDLRRGVLADSPTVERALGRFLVDSLAGEERLRAILQYVGLEAAAAHFTAHIAPREHVRIGDFGEIVAGRLLEDMEELSRPVEKLRHRETPEWPMKLTDVFCIKLDAGEIVSLVFCEAKAGTTRPDADLAQRAYQQVYEDVEADEPQVLFFAMDRLLDESNHRAYLQLHQAMHRSPPVPRALRLVFVFDDEAWRNDVIDALNDDLISGELTLADDFRFYVLTRQELRAVIAKSYETAHEAAVHG